MVDDEYEEPIEIDPALTEAQIHLNEQLQAEREAEVEAQRLKNEEELEELRKQAEQAAIEQQ